MRRVEWSAWRLLCFLLLWTPQTCAINTFNPVVLRHDYAKYVNDPVVSPSVTLYSRSNVTLPMEFGVNNLLHKPEAGDFTDDSCIMGLALYKNNINMFKRFVGSLRHFEYKGHIILGVSKFLTSKEKDYLIKMDVTMYTVEITECEESAIGNAKVKGPIRNKCSQDIPDLKLEWGRFEMARRWLLLCEQCTGWSMVVDTRDTFFQDHPFRSLDNAITSSIDLFFVEEVSPYTLPPGVDPQRGFVAGNIRSQVHTVPCYGKTSFKLYKERPVLCSGSVVGNRHGMLRFLSVMVTEFYENNLKSNAKCKSPHTTDQWIMNWLYYNGQFGHVDRTVTLPWGSGPVLTVGKACMTAQRKTGATDLVQRASNGNGLLMNQFSNKVAPVVHQFDRCFPWIKKFFDEHQEVYHPPLLT